MIRPPKFPFTNLKRESPWNNYKQKDRAAATLKEIALNETYNLTVSEPWNYSGADGTNNISGKVIKHIGIQCLVFQSTVPVKIDGLSGDLLVLFPRYASDSFDKQVVEIPANVGLLLRKDYENLDEKQLENSSRFVIVGSLKSIDSGGIPGR